MRIPRHTFIPVLLLWLAFGCNSGEQERHIQKKAGEILIADTIIYDVIVKNNNPEDKWTDETLGSLKLQTLLDELFLSIYENQATAYDYFSEKKIRPATLQKMEEEEIFIRSAIGKIQFTEVWFYDSDSLKFRKEVLSLVLGQELYDLDGNVRGYKPVFRIDLQP